MIKLFKYLRKSVPMVLLIVALLGVQAYCDLSLPTYTSQIVDVGIQQGGIDHVAPKQLRRQTMTDLQLFMSDAQITRVNSAYEQQADGIYKRIAQKSSELQQLDQDFGQAMLMLSQVQSSEQMSLDAVRQMIDAGQLTKAEIQEKGQAALAQMGGQSSTIVSQKAVFFVQEEYKAMGLDLGKIQTDYLWATGAKMLLVSLLMVAAAVTAGLVASRTAAKVGMDLRGDVFKKVVSFSSAEIDRFSTASLITRSTNDIQQIQMVIVMMLRIVIYAPIIGIGGVVKVMSTETGMSWIIAVAVGVIMLLVFTLMGVAMPKFKRMQKLIDRLNLVAREILTGIPVIRAFSREKHEEKRFDLANLDLKKTQLFTNRVMTFMMPTMMLIMNGISVLIVWNGAKGIDLGNMQVGDMIAFITYTMQIVMAFLMISMISIMLPRAGVAAERINEVLGTKPTIRDKHVLKDQKLDNCQGVLEFEDVSFHYPDAGADVIEHISFVAKPGQTTAIIGSTGAGKSTVLNLIPRFFDATYGRITIDGVDIRDLSQHKLRSLLGYVPQKGVLFSGDIESNLKFAGETITDEAMEMAIQIAQAAEFIDSKPERYQTPIAQGGTNVSGGQKQRLSIARAIAAKPKILLFDDSFSALDYKTDVILRRALSERVKDATVLIVAQRISTILHADQILVLEEGKIVGKGTHEELMKTCKTYQEIAKSQLSEAELGGVGA